MAEAGKQSGGTPQLRRFQIVASILGVRLLYCVTGPVAFGRTHKLVVPCYAASTHCHTTLHSHAGHGLYEFGRCR